MRLLRRLGPGHHRRKADELAVMFRLVLGPDLLHRRDLENPAEVRSPRLLVYGTASRRLYCSSWRVARLRGSRNIWLGGPCSTMRPSAITTISLALAEFRGHDRGRHDRHRACEPRFPKPASCRFHSRRIRDGVHSELGAVAAGCGAYRQAGYHGKHRKRNTSDVIASSTLSARSHRA